MESFEAWQEHFRDLRQHGLRPPLLGITDGAPGLVAAFEQLFPESLRQRCAIHKARNLVGKVAKADAEEVKRDYWAIFNGIEAPPGEAAVAVAYARASEFDRVLLRCLRHLLMRLVDTHGGDRPGDRAAQRGGTSEESHRSVRMADAARDPGAVEPRDSAR